MIDKERIRLMAKMAVYDKKGFERDAQANQYFRHDFIYKKNMALRFSVGVGCLILALFYFLHMLVIQERDIFTLDFRAEFVALAIFAIVVMVFYSLIGTIIFTREFLLAQRRVEEYFGLMRQLNGEADENERNVAEEIVEEDEDLDALWQNPHITRRASRHLLTYDEDELDESPASRRARTASLEYNYKSSDDPEFWDDEPTGKGRK
ncbi:MAG: hypothetical protein FWE33_04335 [Defluviitaleaceae bacterium]|nr:hypothetical protein [Defluviitaleaceae bacterium]